MINEYMRKKKEGLTLGEKIEEHLRAVKEKGLVQLLEAFFVEEKDRGCAFQVRRSDFMQDKRTFNIIDEIEERFKAEKSFNDAEAKRDMTYQEFIMKYIDHIEGKVDADQRMGTRPITADDGELQQPPDKQSSHVKNNSSMNNGLN